MHLNIRVYAAHLKDKISGETRVKCTHTVYRVGTCLLFGQVIHLLSYFVYMSDDGSHTQGQR